VSDAWKSIAAVALGPVILVVGGVLAALHLQGQGELRGPSSYLVERPAEAPPPVAASPSAADPWAPEAGPDDGSGVDVVGLAEAAVVGEAEAAGVRTVLVRPDSAAPGSPAGGADAAPPQNRARTGPSSPSPAALREAMAVVLPSIRACVSEWEGAGEVLDGQVVVEFVLGPKGVEEASIVDVDNVPPLIGTCFASAVWAADWPAAADRTTVRYPFELTPD
jgi:hypothetical protein